MGGLTRNRDCTSSQLMWLKIFEWQDQQSLVDASKLLLCLAWSPAAEQD